MRVPWKLVSNSKKNKKKNRPVLFFLDTQVQIWYHKGKARVKSGLRHVRYVVCVFILQGLDPVFFIPKNKIEQDVLFYFLLAPIQMLSSSTKVLKRRIPCLVPCTMAVAKSLLVQSRGTKIPSSTMFIRKRSRSCFIQ